MNNSNKFYHDHEIIISLDITTLKVRKAIITEPLDDIMITTKFYKENIKVKNCIFIKTRYKSQVIIFDSFNTFYAEFFKKKSYNFKYVKKLYRNYDLNEKIEFLKKTYNYIKKFYKGYYDNSDLRQKKIK